MFAKQFQTFAELREFGLITASLFNLFFMSLQVLAISFKVFFVFDDALIVYFNILTLVGELRL